MYRGIEITERQKYKRAERNLCSIFTQKETQRNNQKESVGKEVFPKTKIYYIIENISMQLSTHFEQELNQIINYLMESYEIQEIIKNCF